MIAGKRSKIIADIITHYSCLHLSLSTTEQKTRKEEVCDVLMSPQHESRKNSIENLSEKLKAWGLDTFTSLFEILSVFSLEIQPYIIIYITESKVLEVLR